MAISARSYKYSANRDERRRQAHGANRGHALAYHRFPIQEYCHATCTLW